MRTFLVLVSCGLLLASMDAGEKAVLARMDQTAPAFRSLTAKVKRERYTAIIKQTDEDSGTILLKRNGPHDVQMRVDLTAPDPKTVVLHGTKFEVYYPKIKTVQEYDLSKYRGLIDQYLLLGFGTTGKDLAKSYTVGEKVQKENIAGQPSTRLTLIPKSKQALEQFQQVDLWISDATGVPVQQKFLQTSGDYFVVIYLDLNLNPPLDSAALNLELPNGVIREYPQK
jgi:outer membrane lipoprotein-sorting protein